MKHIILLIFLASIGSIIYGFTLPEVDTALADKFKGFGTIGLFLVAMPLFIFTAAKGKNIKDYMLTKENILKMNKEESEKPENQ